MSRLARFSFSVSPDGPVVGIAANSDPRSNFSLGDDARGWTPLLLVGLEVFRKLCFSRVDVGEYVLFVTLRDFGLSNVGSVFSEDFSGLTGEGSLEAS